MSLHQQITAKRWRLRSGFGVCSGLLLLSLWIVPRVQAGAFVFAGEANGVAIITHRMGYDGTGGNVVIRVGIDPTSANAAEMQIPVQNIIDTFNNLLPTTRNLLFGTANNIPSGQFDFESVALHELGHALGLGHPNLASESGLPLANQNYTKTTDGADNTFNLAPGGDGIKGSRDDMRGDDVNLHWSRTSNNNPFTLPETVDSTTYSRDIADLPIGDNFAANADRDVAMALGAPDSEAVMQQGTPTDEARRRLSYDDVATFQYAMAGVDETAGTADDYTVTLTYAGLTTAADIVIDFDNSQTLFAVTQTNALSLSATHFAITSAAIFFNNGVKWFFNDVRTPSRCHTCGDFNSDGFMDLAIGVPGETVTGQADAGAINVIHGSANGLRRDAQQADQLWHQDALGIAEMAAVDDQFGASLGAGDFNLDGFVDLAIGIPNETVSGLTNAGAVQVIYGTADGLHSDNGLTVRYRERHDQLWHQDQAFISEQAEANDYFGRLH